MTYSPAPAFAEDAPHVSGDLGIPALAVRTDVPAALAGTTGDYTPLITDSLGRLHVNDSPRASRLLQQTTITSSTSETTIATAVASTFLDLYGLIITNTSATGLKVTIKDSTAGTTRAVIWVPANDTRGFMLPAGNGLPQATVNNNWTATCGTSVASVEITVLANKTT